MRLESRPASRWLRLVLVGVAVLSCAGGRSPAPAQKSAAAPAAVAAAPAPPPLPETLSLADGFAPAIARVAPAIVNISTTRIVRNVGSGPFSDDPFFAPFFFDVPRERRERSLGSGVIVSSDGYILTNHHVVGEASDIRVSLADHREFHAKIVGTDPKTDIALIKIEAKNLPTATFGDSRRVRVGEFVLALGNPFGLEQSVTFGIVSAVGRGSIGIVDYEDFIQTDAAINPGNSGGALVNWKGELIGINTAILSRTQGNHGIGFAVPAHLAKAVMEQLRAHGRVRRGYLGVSIQEVTPALAEVLGLAAPRGALIGDVVPGGPAARAGLARGDVIVAIDGAEVESDRQLRMRIAQTLPGTRVTLAVWRDGARRELSAVLGELPEEPPSGRERPESARSGRATPLGVEVSTLTPALARRVGVPEDTRGVVITGVEEGGRAAEAGLRVGDVILEANRKRVTSVAALDAIAKEAPRGKLLLLVRHGDSTRFVLLDLSESRD